MFVFAAEFSRMRTNDVNKWKMLTVVWHIVIAQISSLVCCCSNEGKTTVADIDSEARNVLKQIITAKNKFSVFDLRKMNIRGNWTSGRAILVWKSEIIRVISNLTRAARSFDFEITRMISDQIALYSLYSVQYVLGELTKHKYRINSRYCEHSIIIFRLLMIGWISVFKALFLFSFLFRDSLRISLSLTAKEGLKLSFTLLSNE